MCLHVNSWIQQDCSTLEVWEGVVLGFGCESCDGNTYSYMHMYTNAHTSQFSDTIFALLIRMHHTTGVDDRSTCNRQLCVKVIPAPFPPVLENVAFCQGQRRHPHPHSCSCSCSRPPLNSLKSSFVRFHYVSLPAMTTSYFRTCHPPLLHPPTVSDAPRFTELREVGGTLRKCLTSRNIELKRAVCVCGVGSDRDPNYPRNLNRKGHDGGAFANGTVTCGRTHRQTTRGLNKYECWSYGWGVSGRKWETGSVALKLINVTL